MNTSYQPVPLKFEHLTETQQLERSRAFLAQMRRRRTVRHFATNPIPDELIENAVATAGTAPSGANQQPWTFVSVSDASIKRAIRHAAEAEERESYAHRMSQEWLDALAPLGTDWHKPHLEEAPYLLVVFKQAYGLKTTGDVGEPVETTRHYYVDESVGIAVGLLLASLHLAGLATLTHTPSPMKFLAQILKRPSNERAMMIIATGYPAPSATVPNITKKKLDEILVRF